MKTACLQPSFFPDIAHLMMLWNSDRSYWVYGEQFSRKGKVHRGMIPAENGTRYVQIPPHPDDRNKKVDQIRIESPESWKPVLLRTLKHSYRNSTFFDFYEPELEAALDDISRKENLIDALKLFSERLFLWLEWPESKKPVWIRDASEIPLNETEEIWVEEGSQYYRPLIPNSVFPDPDHPEYRQHSGGFVKNCCALDLLFNVGPDSYKLFS